MTRTATRDLVGCTADQNFSPPSGPTFRSGRPAGVDPREPCPGPVVGIGAVLTAVSLLTGSRFCCWARSVSSPTGGVARRAAIVLGAVLAGTHWGWVHVARAPRTRSSAAQREVLERRRAGWRRSSPTRATRSRPVSVTTGDQHRPVARRAVRSGDRTSRSHRGDPHRGPHD